MVLRRLVPLLLAAACSSGAAVTTTTGTTTAATTTSVPALLAGFEVRTVLVSNSPWSVAVADEPALRSRGLMGVTDLGSLDGMLFVFDSEVRSGFWMKDTLIPLDIAFFDEEGVFVDLLAMVPCEVDPCPVYTPVGDYRYALEAGAGAFAAIDAPFLDVGSDQGLGTRSFRHLTPAP